MLLIGLTKKKIHFVTKNDACATVAESVKIRQGTKPFSLANVLKCFLIFLYYETDSLPAILL